MRGEHSGGNRASARGVPPWSHLSTPAAVDVRGARHATAPRQLLSRCELLSAAHRAAFFAARMSAPMPARSPNAVPWRERPPFWTAWPAKPAASEVVAHATLSLPQPERVLVERVRPGGVEGVQIRVVNSGRRTEIVRLATRALKALRASSVPLRPRCARLTALTARLASRVSGNYRRPLRKCLTTFGERRYCRIIFAGCSSQPPPHRPMWSTFESAVSGHGSFPTSQTTSWSSVRATSRPRNR